MKPYKPSNITPPEGIKNLTIVAIATGIVTGGIIGFISQFLYLIILFPILMGGVAGTAISLTVKSSKVRNPVLAAGFGSLTGLILYTSMNYLQYMTFKQEVRKEIITETGKSDDEAIAQLTDAVLKEATGDSGFVGYVKYSAKQGLKITRAGSSGSGITLDENGTWIYSLIELALISGIASYQAFASANEPFCEEGKDWYGDKVWSGCVELGRKDEFLGLLKSETYHQAARLILPQEDLELPRLDLYVQSCPTSPLSNFVLTVSKTSLNSKKNVESKQLVTGLLTHRNRLDLLANQIANQPVENQPVVDQSEPEEV
jgi:hypothetical protein